MRRTTPVGVPAAVERTVSSLEASLELSLKAAIYSTGYRPLPDTGRHSDGCLVVLVSPSVELFAIRSALHSVWSGTIRVPQLELLVATSTELVRHLDFEPGLLGDLTERGQLVHGGYPLPATRPEAIEADRLARLTWAAFEYSALLAPSLLSPHQSSQLHLGLQSLYEDLSDETPRPSLAPAEMLGYIYKELGNDIDGQAAWDYRPDIRTSEPLPMPGLVAVYEKQQELILVVAEEWSTDFAAKATTTNWDRLSERAVGHYRAIRVTTPGQLRLIVTNDDVADFFLGYYSRIWGSDVLANVEVRHRRVLQNLGRWPSYLAVAEMSQLLVSSDDSELFMLVHDLQNRLLNVQLRNELFCRRLGLAPQTPPIALPEPSAPARQRLEAVSIHLHGWADHYWEAMCAVDEQLLLPA